MSCLCVISSDSTPLFILILERKYQSIFPKIIKKKKMSMCRVCILGQKKSRSQYINKNKSRRYILNVTDSLRLCVTGSLSAQSVSQNFYFSLPLAEPLPLPLFSFYLIPLFPASPSSPPTAQHPPHASLQVKIFQSC